MPGPNRAQRRAAQRALAATPSNLVEMEGWREKQSLYGKDSPPPTLQKWRGELWGSLTWPDLVSIMVNAEQTGATEYWARLTRRMYQDGRILAVRGNRLDPISGADFDVEPGGTEEIDILAAADTDAMLRSLPDLPTKLDAALDGLFVGWGILETMWTVKGAWIWPADLVPIEPHRIRFTTTIEPYLYDDGRLTNDPNANAAINLNGKPLRENKFIVHMPRAIPEYPVAAGLCRAIVRYWWAKWQAVAYGLAGAEVAGNPRAIGYYGDPASSGTTRAELYAELRDIAADGVIVTSDKNRVEFVAPLAQGSGSVWNGITEWADNGITLTVLGSSLNTEVGDTGGNRALGESQGAYTIDPRLMKDSGAMWSTFCRDLVTPFLKFNMWRYGDRMPKIPKIKSRFMEELEPIVDDLIVSVGGVSVNDVRRARGHAEWTKEQGGENIAKVAQTGGFGAFTAGDISQQASQTTYASAGGAPAAAPFAPWEAVERMSREAE